MRENCYMPNVDHSLGLRERKKLKTRETIRREAFRLIDENGWVNTTVEQIAEAAEVSPSTFFRYFPSKESVLMADDMDPLLMAEFAKQPAELSPLTAFCRAAEATFEAMSDDQWEFERTRQRLIFSIPELQSAYYEEYRRTIRVITEALGQRLGRDPDDFELKVFAGALTGAMMGVADRNPMSVETIRRALDFLEAGMPLT